MAKEYNLQLRTKQFSLTVLRYCRLQKLDVVSKPLISQLVRSATSIGANYSEAVGASSKKDFRNKIYICKKEAQETRYWLELLSELNPESAVDIEPLLAEITELIKIFHTIGKNSSD